MADVHARSAWQIVPVELAWEAAPCVCVARHAPQPKRTELHHRLPIYMGGPRNGPTVPLDPTGHDLVHWAIGRFEKAGGIVPLSMNRYLYDLAVEAWTKAGR